MLSEFLATNREQSKPFSHAISRDSTDERVVRVGQLSALNGGYGLLSNLKKRQFISEHGDDGGQKTDESPGGPPPSGSPTASLQPLRPTSGFS